MTTTTAQAATRKATPMEQWADYTLRATLSCGHYMCDGGTLRVGQIVFCGSDCGSARVTRTVGMVAA